MASILSIDAPPAVPYELWSSYLFDPLCTPLTPSSATSSPWDTFNDEPGSPWSGDASQLYIETENAIDDTHEQDLQYRLFIGRLRLNQRILQQQSLKGKAGSRLIINSRQARRPMKVQARPAKLVPVPLNCSGKLEGKVLLRPSKESFRDSFETFCKI